MQVLVFHFINTLLSTVESVFFFISSVMGSDFVGLHCAAGMYGASPAVDQAQAVVHCPYT